MKRTADLAVQVMARRWSWVALFAVLFTLAIALVQGIGQSVWFDESYSIMLAQQPIAELVRLTGLDAHPPGYYLYLKMWGTIFGWTELSLRVSSALLGALTVGIVIVLLRRLFSPRVAVLVAPFLVLAPFMSRYDYEVRMYALVALIGALATLLLVQAVKTGAKHLWIIYMLLVAGGMYTLYMSIVFWVAHVAWLVYQQVRRKRPILKQSWLLYYLGAILLFLPWVPTVMVQLQNSALPPYMSALGLVDVVNVISMLLSYHAWWQVDPWLALGIIAWVVVMAMLAGCVWRASGGRYRQGIILLSIVFFGGMLFYAAISLPPNPPRFMERYVVHISPFLYALCGVIVVLGYRLRHARLASIALILSMGLMIGGQVTLHQVGNYNFQRAQGMDSASIRQTIGCDDTTYVTSGPFGYIDMWYELQGCPLKMYRPWDDVLVGGYAPVTNSPDRIKDTSGIMTKRIASVHYEDDETPVVPDARYRLVGQYDFDKVYVKIYER